MSETPLTPGTVGEFNPAKGGTPQAGSICLTICTSLSRKQAITVQLPPELHNRSIGEALEYALNSPTLNDDQKMAAANIKKILYGDKPYTLAASSGQNSYNVKTGTIVSQAPSTIKNFQKDGQTVSFRTIEIQVSQRVDGGKLA